MLATGLSTFAHEFLARVRSARSIVIGTHLNPDGDALGSALAMAFALDSLGIRADVVCNNLAPYNMQFLPHVERVRTEARGPYDLAIALDLDSLHRLGRHAELFETCPQLVIIDHHVPHEEPGTLRLVDPDAPATALILYRLFIEMGIQMSPEIATCLMTGIVTDTGSFRYRNTTEEALHATADLLHHGGQIVQIGEEVYARRPLASVRLVGRCLDRFKMSANSQLAWCALSAKDFEETGASEELTEGLANELLSIKTVKIAALLRQPAHDKVVRASLRSREPYDVAAVARTFGGGGHKNAAGITFEGTLAEAESKLVAALEECLA